MSISNHWPSEPFHQKLFIFLFFAAVPRLEEFHNDQFLFSFYSLQLNVSTFIQLVHEQAHRSLWLFYNVILYAVETCLLKCQMLFSFFSFSFFFFKKNNNNLIALMTMSYFIRPPRLLLHCCCKERLDLLNVIYIITCRAKLLNADWLRQRAFFLNQEGTFGNQEGMITWCWLAEPACIKLVSRLKRILKRNLTRPFPLNVKENQHATKRSHLVEKQKDFSDQKRIDSQPENSLSGDGWCWTKH